MVERYSDHRVLDPLRIGNNGERLPAATVRLLETGFRGAQATPLGESSAIRRLSRSEGFALGYFPNTP